MGVMPMSATRERAVFQDLARDELPGLYALARRLCRDEAEDLVQDCLLRAYRSFASPRERDAAGAWLRVILANAWRDRVRKQSRSPREGAAR
jgi:RNA polymerase sigma-70 factor (ECF subfamily)